MTVSKRSASAGSRRQWGLVLAGVASLGLGCKSTGASGAPPAAESERKGVECPAQLLQPQQALTYTVDCTGFTPEAQKVHAGGQVKFVSACDDKVFVSFSNPETLFTSEAKLIVLESRGQEQTETVSDRVGCHMMCFGSELCPPPDDIDSKTGSLDVHTSVPDPRSP